MKQIDCEGFEIRDELGAVLFSSIVDLLIGDEEKNEYMDYHSIVISLPEMAAPDLLGKVLYVWDTTAEKPICACQVESSNIDFQRQACKVEGKHITATRFKGR